MVLVLSILSYQLFRNTDLVKSASVSILCLFSAPAFFACAIPFMPKNQQGKRLHTCGIYLVIVYLFIIIAINCMAIMRVLIGFM